MLNGGWIIFGPLRTDYGVGKQFLFGSLRPFVDLALVLPGKIHKHSLVKFSYELASEKAFSNHRHSDIRLLL